MSFHSAVQKQERTNTEPMASNAFLQRKCDCGQHADTLSALAASRFGHDFTKVSLYGSRRLPTLPSRQAPLAIQRFPRNQDEVSTPCPTCPEAESSEVSATPKSGAEEAPPSPEAAPTPAEAEPTAEPAALEGTRAPGLIVEDSAIELRPGQMRKSEFLAQLRAEVSRAVDAALEGTGRDTEGCPYLENWFDFYHRQDSAHVERAIRRYAPETGRATTAAEYIPIIAGRARQSVEVWARTGKITGVPEGLPMGMSGIGLLGGIGTLFSGIGSLFFKARGGGVRKPDDPSTVQAKLGEGRPLEGSVRSPMESAFGTDFSQVRTHTDTTAAGLSNNLNARAFTIGEHIAFGTGEYQPGTLIGDALIAHELAHVVQQSGGESSFAPMKEIDATYNNLEDDADKSAEGVLVSLLGSTKGKLSNITRSVIPQLRSGLSLQRCRQDGRRERRERRGAELAPLCDDEECLKRSGCDAGKCKEEAKTITDAYVNRVNAIRRPDMPNVGDIHWGWLCYQWAGLLAREFEKLNLNCWQIRWVGLVSSGSTLEHNYIFTSLGPAKSDEGPVRDCGLILDPWRTGDPVVYGSEWDWHKWNYIHDTTTNTGKYYDGSTWIELHFPIPATPPEPTSVTP